MSWRVRFVPVKPGSGVKCAWCYSTDVRGRFERNGRAPLPACRRHYQHGMVAVVRFCRERS